MSAIEQAAPLTQALQQAYRHGFVTDVDADSLPPGLDDGHRACDLAAQARTGVSCSSGASRPSSAGRRCRCPSGASCASRRSTSRRCATTRRRSRRRTARRAWPRSTPSCSRPTRSSACRCTSARALAGVAVDAVFDSVSVGTTFREQLAAVGVIFCSFSHAVQNHPELIERYLGSVVPQGDNFYAALNSAVFSDGSFVYIPEGVRCPMELSSYFRINARNTGQFERTLIIAEAGSQVSYLEGCTAPQRDETPAARRGGRARRARRRAHQVFDGAELVPRRRARARRHLQLRHQARPVRRQALAHRVDADRDRQRDHLEVPERRAARRRLARRVPLDRGVEPLPAGRHRHQDDPPRPQHDAAASSPRASAPATRTTATAGWCASRRPPRARAITPSAIRC